MIKNKKVVLCLSMYIGLLVFAVLAHNSKSFKSGVCTPSFDMLFFFLIGLISLGAILVSIINLMTYPSSDKSILIIHILVFFAWLSFLFLND